MKKNDLFIVKVKSAHEGQVFLALDEKQEIIIAKKFLPAGLQENEELIVKFYTQKQYQDRKKNIGEAILKEILGK